MTDRRASSFETLGVIAAVLDRNGALIAWTGEFRELIGEPADRLPERPLWEFASANDRDSMRRALIETANDRRSRRVDAVMASGAGERRMAWLCSSMSRADGDSIVVRGVDVATAAASDLAPLAAELQGTSDARDQELSAIYENVPGIVFYVAIEPDGEFRFLSMSSTGLVAMGLTRAQVVGALVRDVIPPPSRDLVMTNYREAVRSGRTVGWKEVTVYPAGRKVGEVAVTPLYDVRGVATNLIGIVHDITERERLEDTLRQREDRLAFLLQLNDALRPLSDPVEIQDVTVRLIGEYLRVNRVAYSVIDGEDFIDTRSYENGVEPLYGRHPIIAFGQTLLDAYRRGESVTASDVRTDPRFTEAERTTLLAYGIVAFIRVILRKDGRWSAIFGVNSATPRHWTEDEIALIEQTAERMWSAAERARTEAALREREQRLRLALEASAGGSWTRDADAHHIDWDEGFRRLYGIPFDEPPTFDGWLRRIHAEDRPKVLNLVDDLLHPTKDAWDIVFRIARPDGTVAWIQSLGRAERDSGGKVTRLIGLELDVTARRRAEEARQARRDEEHNRELRLLLETATQGIVSVDARGVVITANRALEAMFGWAPGELLGQSVERLVPSAARGLHVQHRSGYFATPRPRLMAEGLELVGERKDGSRFPIEVHLNHVVTPAGGHAIAFVTDITARKRADLTLQERTAELERRTAQLRQMASDLTLTEQHAREQLAKTLHDGLQQLLVSAAMNVDRLSQRGAPQRVDSGDVLKEVRNHLDEAIDAARSLSFELFPPVLQTSGLPAALVWLADWTRKKYGLEVEVRADPVANSSRKDTRTLLFESVRELLLNAAKHARTDRVTVDLTLEANDMLSITVADQGIGFDPRGLIERAKGGQAGWGLFSIRERLTLLGGRFDTESAPGLGTTFRLKAPRGAAVHLDLVDSEPPSSAMAIGSAFRDAGVAPLHTLRVLIVDDHNKMRKALQGLLQERRELKVVGEAANGVEAITQAHALRPDVIVMDVSMPVMDGVEATRRIRAELPTIRIVGLSMYSRTEVLDDIEQAGAECLFTKGADTRRLVDHLVAMQLASRRLTQPVDG